MAALRDAWTLAVQGARQVVFVGGEPGVGKSRIVAEIATEAHGQQAAVLLGTCMSTMGAPHQPFVEPIAALVSAVVAGQLTMDGTDEAVRGQLERLRAVAGADRSGPEPIAERQFTPALFRACTDVLQAAAAVRPLVLVLEDVHWAGDTALQLLRYLVGQTAESRMLILATQRTTAPDRCADLVTTVAQLYRLDGVRRIDLDGLTTEEITDYIAHEAKLAPRRARGPAAVLRDQTGGNPFLLQEVWRELVARGGITALADLDLRAPDSVLDTVQHRLAGLPSLHRRTVETAAVIGEEFSVAVLTATLREARPDPDAAALTYAGLEAAMAVGLLESARDLDGVVRFPHGLARQAVLDLMTEYQRATENARVAKVLEEQFPAVDLRVQRLAHHYANAQALGYAD
ncbi:MAG TPA: AAA family ATPase, partial [Nakamurella sp.]|nr:AAA family ATPase [Nakamurella sp.]